MGVNSKNKQWQRLKLIPGRITENIVQALARDILANAKVALEDYGFDTVLSVHDEVVVELPLTDPEGDLSKISELMCDNPAWCPDLPLEAEGVLTRRYYKI
jgi:DNA polymerase